MPAPGNGHTDNATEAVHDALDAVQAGYPGGELFPVPALQERVARAHKLDRQCRFQEVGREHNEATSLASAAFGLAQTLTIGGSFVLAQTVIDKTTLPPVTSQTAGLVCATA